MDTINEYEVVNVNTGAVLNLRSQRAWGLARRRPSVYKIRKRETASTPEPDPTRETVITALESLGEKIDRRNTTEKLQAQLDKASAPKETAHAAL
jgi:hypothetical protein